jgi:ferredoxin
MLHDPIGWLGLACAATGVLVALLFAVMAIVSRAEREPRAARIALLLTVVLPLPYLAAGLLSFPGRTVAAGTLLVLPAAAAAILLLPIRGARRVEDDTPGERIDERDIMFSRRLLREGSDRFEDYYRAHPDRKPLDDAFRARPGLLAEGSAAYHPLGFRAADSSFWTIERLGPFVDGEPAAERVATEPARITRFLKSWARKLGAVSAGVTRLRDYHKYSVVGRGPEYGRPVTLDHDFAVALTVEMDKLAMDPAPLAPTLMESAQQYVASGVIAVQVAYFLRRLGYRARAHIDGNYRVVCPLVARDAGLGEIGRMGLLMTPELGPRVRIAVVTTDLPLVPDDRRAEPSTLDFCTHCRKCAEVCPSKAIPFGGRAEIDGTRRWRIDSEACFTYWCQVGTDCARCVKACPYSHPDNLLHNSVRRGIRNSALFRRLAIVADDLFYGKKPLPSAPPDWMDLPLGVS